MTEALNIFCAIICVVSVIIIYKIHNEIGGAIKLLVDKVENEDD